MGVFWMTMLHNKRSRAPDAAPKAYYAPADVAELLGVSKQTVLNRIHDGQLDAVRVSPRVYRVPFGALQRFLRPGAPPRVRWVIQPKAKVSVARFDRELAREHGRRARG